MHSACSLETVCWQFATDEQEAVCRQSVGSMSLVCMQSLKQTANSLLAVSGLSSADSRWPSADRQSAWNLLADCNQSASRLQEVSMQSASSRSQIVCRQTACQQSAGSRPDSLQEICRLSSDFIRSADSIWRQFVINMHYSRFQKGAIDAWSKRAKHANCASRKCTFRSDRWPPRCCFLLNCKVKHLLLWSRFVFL